MNFFAAQDRARTASRWLVIVYLAATALIVAGAGGLILFVALFLNRHLLLDAQDDAPPVPRRLVERDHVIGRMGVGHDPLGERPHQNRK